MSQCIGKVAEAWYVKPDDASMLPYLSLSTSGPRQQDRGGGEHVPCNYACKLELIVAIPEEQFPHNGNGRW